MYKFNILIAIFTVFIFNACSNIQPIPTYNKDYSNKKVFAKYILVQNEYQAKNIINQLNSSINKLETGAVT